ncbi:MAG TPA: 3-phosphoshikimate 1-carboxyvinyltransferase [Pyrinomonadaceae bacterium]|jgi:3-phosphoshikimate 1-carboxyvinyltransferase|nr:3-phosphoshikimate 1-carboxyvinyltransferase [Pyrinomonadaceae bacterium]
MKIQPAENLQGTINLPGDKSISHRAGLFSAMAHGETRIENFATSADCASTLSCLEQLGVEIRREDSTVFVKGVGKTGFKAAKSALDCGNSGTTMRLLAGILAGQNFDSVLTGDESLSGRPMKRVIEPLSQMDARIEATENHAPLRIFGKNPLKAISFEGKVASAQVKSCVLLAGLNGDGKTSVLEKTPTRDHTERMLRWFGVDVDETEQANGKLITVQGDANLTAKDLLVPSDVSSAAFFLVAAACLKGSEILLPNVGLNPTRNAVVEVLKDFGAEVEVLNLKEIGNEPIGDLLVRGRGNGNLRSKLSSNVLRGKIIANLIDEIPILAVFGTQIEGGLEIREASELRVKESDRIRSVVENLRKMNARVEEFEDGFRVEKSELKGASVESFGDHRIAMAFAVAALFATGETQIANAECAAVSFPAFFETLRSVSK